MSDQVENYVLTVLGQDRPGIVASVTDALAKAGCNIEQSSMSVLGTSFAMILVVNVPVNTEREFRTGLVGITTVEDLKIHVDPFPQGALHKTIEGDSYSLNLHGSDHPGIISAVTRVLSENNINISDLATRLIPGEKSIFLMTIDLIVPAEVDVEQVTDSLKNIGNDIECEIIFTGDDSITC